MHSFDDSAWNKPVPMRFAQPGVDQLAGGFADFSTDLEAGQPVVGSTFGVVINHEHLREQVCAGPMFQDHILDLASIEHDSHRGVCFLGHAYLLGDGTRRCLVGAARPIRVEVKLS